MNQPNKNKFTIKKPRITLTDEQKKQARSGMAGEAVKASAETTVSVQSAALEAEVTPPVVSVPAVPETINSIGAPDNLEVPVLVTEPVSLPNEPVELPTPERLVAEITQNRQQGRGRGRKAEKNIPLPAEDSETQHVRMSKDTVLRAKMNVLLLPSNLGIRSLRDYGDAAFAFYDDHLRKTGKLPKI